jgi:ElaA protein|tara:strand:- start:9269 stop:9733 length:465 start_codon:yes stop_codon:yes gene_type:complete
LKKEEINWVWKEFKALTADELYSILKLRIEVFSVEQECIYQDLDGIDNLSFHLMGLDNSDELVAYLRLISPDVKFKEPSIARVVTSLKANFRGMGLGKLLVEKGIKKSMELYPNQGNRIGAQKRLVGFYEYFGFKISGSAYLEDGIPHINMVLD